MTASELNELSNKIIGKAIEVHKELGPGFIERIYREALIHELKSTNVALEREKYINVNYKNKNVGQQRIDLIIEGELILEIKSVDRIGNVHVAQLLSYLKTLNKKLGLILNFSQPRLAIKRVVNNL